MRVIDQQKYCSLYMQLKQFQPLIRSAVEIICEEKNEMVKAEYLEHFFLELTQRYSCGFNKPNSSLLVSDLEITSKLTEIARKLGDCLLCNTDCAVSARNYAFSILAIIDGIGGASIHAQQVSFGFYAMIEGAIDKLISRTGPSSRRDYMAVGALRFVCGEINKFYLEGHGAYYPNRPIEWKEINTSIVVEDPDQEWKKDERFNDKD